MQDYNTFMEHPDSIFCANGVCCYYSDITSQQMLDEFMLDCAPSHAANIILDHNTGMIADIIVTVKR